MSVPFTGGGDDPLRPYDFDLPQDLIALRPAVPRDAARLLHVPVTCAFDDRQILDLPALLQPGDLLIMNDTRVIKGALRGVRAKRSEVQADVMVQLNLTRQIAPHQWFAFAKPGRRLGVGERIEIAPDFFADICEKRDNGEVLLAFNCADDALLMAIDTHGTPPIPPYIGKSRAVDAQDVTDYQTVFANTGQSVAAPTAGLHFTPELLAALKARGVQTAHVRLDVGAGTFAPLTDEMLAAGRLHQESFWISEDTARLIRATKAQGNRVIAVGTTSLRALESAASVDGTVKAQAAHTDIFIQPGYQFRVVDGLLTNFHLPRSSLFMLVCALAGTPRMQAAYGHALAQRYRFFSYGDASLLWRA